MVPFLPAGVLLSRVDVGEEGAQHLARYPREKGVTPVCVGFAFVTAFQASL